MLVTVLKAVSLEQYRVDAPKYIGEYVKKMKMALLTN